MNGYFSGTNNPYLGVDFAVATAGGSPYLSGQPTVKLFMYNVSSTYSLFLFLTPDQVTAANLCISCSGSASTGYLSCLTSNGYYTIFDCGSYVYMAAATWQVSGCTAGKLEIA